MVSRCTGIIYFRLSFGMGGIKVNMKTAFIYLVGLVIAILVACWFADAIVKAIEVETYVSDAERIQRAKILKGEH